MRLSLVSGLEGGCARRSGRRKPQTRRVQLRRLPDHVRRGSAGAPFSVSDPKPTGHPLGPNLLSEAPCGAGVLPAWGCCRRPRGRVASAEASSPQPSTERGTDSGMAAGTLEGAPWWLGGSRPRRGCLGPRLRSQGQPALCSWSDLAETPPAPQRWRNCLRPAEPQTHTQLHSAREALLGHRTTGTPVTQPEGGPRGHSDQDSPQPGQGPFPGPWAP